MYLADKKHLEEYGRTITGERYYALPHGPVPTYTYAALQAIAGEEPIQKSIDARLIVMMSHALDHDEGNDFRIRKMPAMGQLSESDVDCLDAVIDKLGDAEFEEIQDATHDAAWKKNWKIAEEAGRKSQAIRLQDIVETLPTAELVAEYIGDPHPN